MDLINGFGRASLGFCSVPPIGSGRVEGRYTLVVSKRHGSGLDWPIGSDRKGVIQLLSHY